MPLVTLDQFLACCSEWVKNRAPAPGLAACDQVLDAGAEGRLLVAALRHKAGFLLMSNDGWALQAIGYLKEALEAAKAYPDEQGAILHTLVVAYSRMASYDQAQRHANTYFRLVARSADAAVSKWAPKVWFALGFAYDSAGVFDKAAEAYRQSREAALTNPEVFNPGLAEHNLVQVYLELGRADEAFHMLQESKAHLDSSAYGGHMKDQEAQCLLALGRYPEAEAACREALADSACTAEVRAEATLTLSRIRLEEGHLHEARVLADQALDLAIRLPSVRLVRKIEGVLRTLHSREEVSNP